MKSVIYFKTSKQKENSEGMRVYDKANVTKQLLIIKSHFQLHGFILLFVLM